MMGLKEEIREYKEESEREKDYFIHIDLEGGDNSSRAKLGREINTYIIKKDGFDPRRATNFPSDLLDSDDEDTVPNRRSVASLGSGYYELWKVRSTFKIKGLKKIVRASPSELVARVIEMNGEDHLSHIFKGRQ